MAIDTTTGPYAVKPIRDFLEDFAPVQKAVANPEQAALTYDILNWHFAPTPTAAMPQQRLWLSHYSARTAPCVSHLSANPCRRRTDHF